METSDTSDLQTITNGRAIVSLRESAEHFRNRQINEMKLIRSRHRMEILQFREIHRQERVLIKEHRKKTKLLEKQRLKDEKAQKRAEKSALKLKDPVLMLELKSLQRLKVVLHQEFHQQLSQLPAYEVEEKKKIKSEFDYLKKLNNLKIRKIRQQLNPTKVPVTRAKKASKKRTPRFKGAQIRKAFQKCIEDGYAASEIHASLKEISD